MAAPAFAQAPPLTGGDLPATVTVSGRPLSADTDHVVSFLRGKTIYVCVRNLRKMVSGSVEHSGNQITIHSFKGDLNSHTYVFAVGSSTAVANGELVHLTAPVVRAYGHNYIPLSFFGQKPLKTHVVISADGRSGEIVLPPGAL